MLKNQYNKEGNREGYWEIYRDNGHLYFKGNYINNIHVGYWEYYDSDGAIKVKYYSIN